MLLNNVTFQGKSIELTDQQDHGNANVITILMGNNGSGKSRLFQAICSTFIQLPRQDTIIHYLNDIENISEQEDLVSLSYFQNGQSNLIKNNNETIEKIFEIGNLKVILTSKPPFNTITQTNIDKDGIIQNISNKDYYHIDKNIMEYVFEKEKESYKKFKSEINGIEKKDIVMPNKVLAITGSPYDKFPFLDIYIGPNSLSPYVYLGTKGKKRTSLRSKRSYLGYKFDQLGASFIKLLLKPKKESFDFLRTFDFLGISHEFTLKLLLSERIGIDPINENSILQVIRGIRSIKNKDQMELDEGHDSITQSKRILEALNYVMTRFPSNNLGPINSSIEITCKIDFNTDKKRDTDLLNALDILSECDLVELSDVILTKSKSSKKFLLSQASSGELSILFTMSSIAGEIEDNSLILIDEPEISLHPEWQLNFLSLLNETFHNYKSCHFIIATHSPNIISSIPKSNAYIVSLDSDTPKLMKSSQYHNKSADFQLASVFNSPGRNNEYLLSKVIEVLDNLCKNKTIDNNSVICAKWLLTFDPKLESGDKVKSLLNILKNTLEALNIR